MALADVPRLVSRALLVSGLLLAVAASAASAQVQPRIVGGSAVSITNHPYQVRLSIVQSQGTFLCGGAIRDATHVVTAAHCVIDEDAGSYPQIVGPGRVIVGYSSANRTAQTTVGVSTVSVSPAYLREGGPGSDVAVLTLASPIDLAGDPEAEAIPFASDAELSAAFGAPGSPAFATGWGVTSEGGTTTPVNLQGVQLQLRLNSVCQSTYGQEYDPTTMLCAGGAVAGGTDTCQGDSGGPLAIDITPATPPSAADWRLVGITSFGNGCARPSVPGVYAWVQSPTLRPFLSAANPVAAPAIPASNPTITGTLRVGQTVRCNAPAVPGAEPAQYLWYVVDGGSFTLTDVTQLATLQLGSELLGAFLICDVRYENAGGFSYSDTPAAARVGPVLAALPPSDGGATGGGGTGTGTGPGATTTPPPAVADTVRPRARVSSVRCLRRRCTINIRASDSGGLVRGLSARLSYRTKRCRTVGSRRRCRSVRRTKRLRATRTSRGFRIKTRLQRNRYTVVAVATDTAGNRSSAARRTFRVR